MRTGAQNDDKNYASLRKKKTKRAKEARKRAKAKGEVTRGWKNADKQQGRQMQSDCEEQQ